MVARSIEQPSLLERFVTLIPAPYPVAALIWAILIPSGLGFDAIALLTTGTSPRSLNNLPNALLNLLFVFYTFLMIRYMRLRVVAAETSIAPRLEGGSENYHRAFGRMTQTLPALLLAAIFATLLILANPPPGGPWIFIANDIVTFIATFAGMTYLWEFTIASWGLHKLGGSSLTLESFQKDRMMGTKPLGNLALSLTVAYFGVILIALLLFSTFVTLNIGTVLVFASFLFLGVALFFLPLNSIHTRMQAEKRRLLREVGLRYPKLSGDSSSPGQTATLEDLHRSMAKLTDLQEVDMLDRKIAALPTWPFDVNVVSKFIAIALSVTAVLITRLITDLAKI